MYPEEMVAPMRQELTSVGVKELKTPKEVDEMLAKGGTTLIIINSVCGCAAGNARPAVSLAVKHEKLPDNICTVFAGVDLQAVKAARDHMPEVIPSSPSMTLFKDGKAIFVLERYQIEGHSPEEISDSLKKAFDEFC